MTTKPANGSQYVDLSNISPRDELVLIPATLSDAPILVVGDEEGEEEDQKQNLAPTCVALAILLVLVALCSNLIAFLLFYKKPVFRKILSNRLVMNLMTINIVSCLVLFPAIIWDLSMASPVTALTTNNNTITLSEASAAHRAASETSPATTTVSPSMIVCIWSTMSSSIVAHASLLAMLTVGVDQYFAVLYSLEYNAKITSGMSLKLIFSVWTIGFCAAAVSSSQLISAGDRSPWVSCREAAVDLSNLEGSLWLFCSSSVAFFLVPVLILTCIYLRIFAAASKNSRGIRRNSFHQLSFLNVGNAPEEIIVEEKELENDLPTPELEDENSPEIAPKPFHEKNVGCGSDVGIGEGSKNSTRIGGPRSNDATTASNAFGASEVLEELEEELKSEHEVDQTSNGPIKLPAESNNKQTSVITKSYSTNNRAPKLRSLKNQAVFSETIGSVGIVDADLSPQVRPKVTRQMSHQDRRAMMTPKRKCSFSSFSECRYVVDGGKTTTFLFAIETPSPSSHDNDQQTNSPQQVQTSSSTTDQTQLSSADPGSLTPIIKRWKQDGHQNSYSQDGSRDTSDHATFSTSNGIDITSNPMFAVGSDNVSRNSSPSPLPSPRLLSKTRHTSLSGDTKLPLSSEASNASSLHKTGSLISMTSQAARRLSVNVSRRASSVYQFFQYKEELRTAKISATVIVVAFICWGPFFLNLALLTLLGPSSGPEGLLGHKQHPNLIYWLHQISNLTMLAFAALSPYLYVFRSRKVQKCLGQVIYDTFCCCSKTAKSGFSRPHNSSRSRNRSLLRCSSSKTLPHRSSLPVGTAGNTLRESPNEENQPQQRDHHSIERERSSSCPNIEAERQPILDNEGMKSPIDDANDLLFDKLLYQPPHVELRPPPPIIVRPLSDMDIYNAVIYEEDGELIPPDEEALSRRRLSASLPFGLNLIINTKVIETALIDNTQNDLVTSTALYAHHATHGTHALESTV